MVYSVDDALRIAREHPDREVVFFAIGFETTTPPTAVAILQAAAEDLANFSVLCCHVLTPAAIAAILDAPACEAPTGVPLDGFVGPAHVSTVIGSDPYAAFACAYRKPVVIAGFEPLDVMQAILMLVRQVNERARRGRERIHPRRHARRQPQGAAADGPGVRVAAQLRMAWPRRECRARRCASVSATRASMPNVATRWPIARSPTTGPVNAVPILRGLKRPIDCKLFGSVCTPETPMGSCMVSSEGACAAHYTYGRHKDTVEGAA